MRHRMIRRCGDHAARAADIAPIIAELQPAGATSLRAIAAGLNDRGSAFCRFILLGRGDIRGSLFLLTFFIVISSPRLATLLY
jgi:hypothetical protein